MDKEPVPTLRDLYSHLTDEELAVVEDQLERYLALMLRIFDRLELESQADTLTPDSDALPSLMAESEAAQ